VPLSGAATPFCGLLTPKCFLRVKNHLFLWSKQKFSFLG
jgi:hypothetical protein